MSYLDALTRPAPTSATSPAPAPVVSAWPVRSPWVGLQTGAHDARLRLIAFHHAGGNARFFQPWLKECQSLN
ncbi:hypothetical protein [Verminephrobacter eiseniae]|uniref:hypothetical protein n=1 Tax=Verminephrobacter eiseniae TaxID=364317 RepID=UPI0010CFD349|nr:hypothetical protein [Verminephrobacter eiseniae]KAB7575705.1 hypothetical protein ET532_018865 [Verminephrobacter sp. Larva24]MCW5232438.1 hypothetical protein [Verminephrobacter eiseniae]MCW5295996.1 hypothetical protein [Verminephrobacter eiseniae]MCW8187355.1 hypothetical protein [Verminephrobacter eiseniae]MCW8226198.1 hypothetical protein [Verminephrobacter eiseniae]